MGKSVAKVSSSESLRLPGWLAEAADALASIFLPAGCRLCEELLTRASRLPICEQCLTSFARIADPLCSVCGLPLDALPVHHPSPAAPVPAEETLCPACADDTFHFDRARSFARYQESLVRAIVLLKFEEMDPLADWFADRLTGVVRLHAKELAADIVVPVPLHKTRRRERGFNQAELLAKRVAKRLGLPHQGVLLVRKRPRPDKHLLTSRERWEAVRGAFATHPGSQVDKRRVLLVDDVMTTGATLDACAKALREAGASAVLGLTVARAMPSLRKFGPPG